MEVTAISYKRQWEASCFPSSNSVMNFSFKLVDKCIKNIFDSENMKSNKKLHSFHFK